MEKVLFYIDGNIGLGKSTLLDMLQDDEKYHVADEPMEKYCEFDIFRPLQMFYNDEISGFQFFTYLYSVVWMPLLDELQPGKIPVVCRGAHTGAYVFGNDDNKPFDIALKDRMAKMYAKTLKKKYERVIVIYLQLSPEECYRRIRERDRVEESGVTLEYITEIHNMHEKFFSGKHEELGFEVLKIEVSGRSREDVQTLVKKCIDDILMEV